MSERLRYSVPKLALLLGLSACATQEPVPPLPSPSAATTEQSQKPPCMMAQGLEVKNGEAVWVQAGIAEFPRAAELGKMIIGRMVYGRDGKTLGRLVPAKGDVHSWKIDAIEDTADARLYTRGSVTRANDACTPPAALATPPASDAQLVTITGAQTVDGALFPSFNDGNRISGDVLAAYNDGGVSITFSKVPGGFRQTN